MRTLDSLKKGETAVIDHLKENAYGFKLLEMGFLPGEEVLMEGKALGGDPLTVKVDNTLVSLRAIEATYVVIADQNK